MPVHRTPATVFYDADCGFCTRSVRLLRTFDWLRLFRYQPLQSQEAHALALAEARSLSQMVFHTGHGQWGGWRAVKQVAFRLPVFYLGLAASALLNPWLPLALLVLFTPLANPLGDAAYAWVARNRHRFPGSTCSLENR